MTTSTSPVFAPAVPAWARTLITSVCAAHGVPLPDKVRWTRKAPGVATSSGKTGLSMVKGARPPKVVHSIAVSAGSDERDQRHVVLHELAHHLQPDSEAELLARRAPAPRGRRTRRDPHNQAFFTRLIPLLKQHGALSIEEAIEREVRTYPSHAADFARALTVTGNAALVPVIRAAKHTVAASRAVKTVVVASHPIVPVARGKTYVCKGCDHRLGPTTVTRYRKLKASGLAHLFTHKLVARGPVSSG